MTKTKRKLLKAMGYALCVVPASLSALEHFPLWLSETKSSLSLLVVLLLAICLWPFKRGVQKVWKNPSIWMLWLCLYIGLKLTVPLAQGLLAVAGVALPFSLLGAVCFRLSRIGIKECEPHD